MAERAVYIPEEIANSNGRVLTSFQEIPKDLFPRKIYPKVNGHSADGENPRVDSHTLEFDQHDPDYSRDGSFAFLTRDGRRWIVKGAEAFYNGRNRIPRGFDFSKFLQNLESLQQKLGSNPQEEHHNGVVDVIWKNWETLWEHFQPGINRAHPARCFREVRLSAFNGQETTTGQPDLVGISPRGAVYIIEVGGSGIPQRKLEKIENYVENFKRVFGGGLTIRSFIAPYDQIDGGYTFELKDSVVLTSAARIHHHSRS